MSAKVLIIDDEDLFREDLASLLRRRGFECRTAPNADDGLAAAEAFGPDVILCDVVMPGKSGIDILDELMGMCSEAAVLMITAYASLDTAVEAFQKGVSDYVMKPLLVEDVLQKIQRLLDYKRLVQEAKMLRREASSDVESLSMVGKSEAMMQVLDLIGEVGPTTSTVLITGESGTGKELIARAIHAASDSADRPFVAINCAGIPDHLFESELFGHVRGAFTGAIGDRVGFFELAGDGAILLDEIGEMPQPVQSKLLRVLEQKEFTRVGGGEIQPLNARVIASTNRNLRERVQEGSFREDLYFRVAVFEITAPPLRERRHDIPLLVEYFVKKFNAEMKRNCLGADSEAMRALLNHSWRGNVRELRNVIERGMILSHGDYITLAHIPAELRGDVEWHLNSDDLREGVRTYERGHIRRVLQACGGNKEETARRLGVNPSTLYRKMAELGFETE